jgi:hypothetical protein
MNASTALHKAAEEALDSLGESAKRAIMWQMSQRGVGMAPDDFNINKFASVLRDLLGEGSETMLGMIHANMCRHLKIDAQAHADVSALERINRVMESKKMN